MNTIELTITRSTWLRGEGPSESCLLRKSDKKQCCIGFLCEVLGVPREDILDFHGVAEIHTAFPKDFPNWLQNEYSDLFHAYRINDDMKLSDKEREQLLTKLFLAHNINVHFVD